MKTATITVTEATRNFADCIDRAHKQNMTYVLLKNGVPYARLLPDNEKVCTGRDLAAALTNAKLAPAEAKAWQRDLAVARKHVRNLRK